MKNIAIMTLRFCQKGTTMDIEVPLTITANELVQALHQTFGLQMDTNNMTECFLKTEHPIALIRGSRTLQEYGLRNGTVINLT